MQANFHMLLCPEVRDFEFVSHTNIVLLFLAIAKGIAIINIQNLTAYFSSLWISPTLSWEGYSRICWALLCLFSGRILFIHLPAVL